MKSDWILAICLEVNVTEDIGEIKVLGTLVVAVLLVRVRRDQGSDLGFLRVLGIDILYFNFGVVV